MQKSNCILTLYLFMFTLILFLYRFRNELARSLKDKMLLSKNFILPLLQDEQLIGRTRSVGSFSCKIMLLPIEIF